MSWDSSTVERAACNGEVAGANPRSQHHPSAERVRELLDYNPRTGIFIWREDRHSHKCKGKRAGSLHSIGGHQRRRIFIDNKEYQEHRIAWLYVTGEWPTAQIDHKDRDATNNKWENLRLDPHLRNNRNRGIMGHNTTGFPGVTRRKNKYVAAIVVGTFATPEEAHAAYRDASILLHGEFSPFRGDGE